MTDDSYCMPIWIGIGIGISIRISIGMSIGRIFTSVLRIEVLGRISIGPPLLTYLWSGFT